jgi:Na+/H+ antiporter NhaD/arsenite permease-like protein
MLHAIRRVDMSSVFFFMGILLCITALKEIGTLEKATQWLDHTVKNHNIIVMLIGVLSSIVDNVPLVAATQAMYSFPTDHVFWEFIAYCAGTGGSMLIIGSAAGVAAMGLEKIDFIWYLRNMSWLAFLGFLGGALVYLLQEVLF